eukprot:SAG11_NODE_300_length_11057_cov_5.223469_8_plen_110_part_00
MESNVVVCALLACSVRAAEVIQPGLGLVLRERLWGGELPTASFDGGREGVLPSPLRLKGTAQAGRARASANVASSLHACCKRVDCLSVFTAEPKVLSGVSAVAAKVSST